MRRGRAVCRVGDHGHGICTLHDDPVEIDVVIISGADSFKINGMSAGTIESIGQSSCGHLTHMTSASSDVEFEKKKAIRVGDTGTTGGGSFTMTTGSPDYFID